MENVTQVHGKKNKQNFENWCKSLEELGYTNYWQDLNGVDYGMPQSRNRCFMLSILDNRKYEFPNPLKLSLELKDLLVEETVDERYYLSESMIRYIASPNEKWTGNNGGGVINKKIASTLNTKEGGRRCDASNYICNELPDNFNLNKIIVNSLNGNKFLIRNTKQLKETIQQNEIIEGNSLDLYNRNVHNEGISQTLDTGYHNAQRVCVKDNDCFDKLINLRIRKLVPLECFRLMGLKDEDINRIIQNQSDTSCFHLAGDSIITNCMMAIFGELYGINWQDKINC